MWPSPMSISTYWLYYRDIPWKSVLCDKLEHELKCRSLRLMPSWSNLLTWHFILYIYISLIYDWFRKRFCVTFFMLLLKFEVGLSPTVTFEFCGTNYERKKNCFMRSANQNVSFIKALLTTFNDSLEHGIFLWLTNQNDGHSHVMLEFRFTHV